MKLKKITALTAALVIFVSNTAYSFDTNMNDRLLMLVNDDYVISDDMVGELVDITGFMPSNKKGIMLRAEAAYALREMYNDMTSQGLRPVAVSGYRNTEYQRRLFDKEVYTQKSIGSSDPTAKASYFTAVPNTSEHQMGLAVDISNNSALSEDFERTPEGMWLAKNCWRYGFVLRYGKNKMRVTDKSYEPWHFRYVGKPHAEYMTKYNLVLEEYIAKLHTREKLEIESSLDGKKYDVVCTADTQKEFENIISVSDDNAGRYIITMLSDKLPQNTPTPAPTPSPKPDRKQDIEKAKNRIILFARNAQLKCENTARYIKEVIIPRTNELRKSFERGVEKVVNKIFEPVYIGGNN